MQLAIKVTGSVDQGFRAWCPALPGCHVCAQSKDQAWERIQEAVQGYLSSLDVALPRELGRIFQAQFIAKAS